METREAADGNRYTQAQFQQHYGDDGIWHERADTSDALQLAAIPGDNRDAPQLAVRLSLDDVIAVRREEALRGPPRSLHNLARDALNHIASSDNYNPVNLDEVFPWIPYVAAHSQYQEIIGSGITEAVAVHVQDTRDANRGGAPRLDFFFFRSDGSYCRVHPGNKSKQDAQLIFGQR